MSILKKVYSLSTIALFALISFTTSPAAMAASPEVVMVYATALEVRAISVEETTAATSDQLAKDYAEQLLAKLNDRLPKELDHHLEVQTFTEAYNDSLIEELDTRLPTEFETLITFVLP